MSLLVWCPFNNNLNNQGTNGAAFSVYNGTVGTYSAGKVTLNSLQLGTGTLSIPNPVIGATNWTIAFWFKPNSPAAWRDIMTVATNSQRIEFGSPMTNLYWYVAGVFTSGTQFSNAITDGVWQHICITFDNGTSTCYINGVQKIQQTGRSTWASNETPIYFGSRISTAYCNVNINDLRIYNHTLSFKEVKELSRGLCLHYKFNFEDFYQPLDFIQGTGTQQIDTGLKFDMTNDYCEVDFASTTTSQNGMIFASNNGTSNHFWFYHYQDGTGIHLYIKNAGSQIDLGKIALDTNRHKMQWRNKQYIMDGSVIGTDIRSLGTTDYNIYLFSWGNNYYYKGRIYGCKIWKSNVLKRDFKPCVRKYDGKPGLFDFVTNTFYTNSGSGEFSYPTTTLLDTNKIKDVSGFRCDGTFSSSVSTNGNTPIGNSCGYLNDVWCNAGSTPPLYMPKMSIFMWVKQPTPTTQRFLFGTFTSWTSHGIGWWVDSGATNMSNLFKVVEAGSYSSGTTFTNVCDGNWHFIGITWDGSTYKTYKDGTLLGSVTATSGQIYNPVYIIGGANFNNEKMQGYLADVRLYATALSQADITELYQAQHSGDSDGNAYANEFTIDTSIANPTLFKTGVAKFKNIAEQITLSDGSTWLPICVHNVEKGLFPTSGTFSTLQYNSNEIWCNFGLINTVERPESGYYEFLVMHQTSVGAAFKSYRWKQNKNPFNAAWGDVSPSVVGTNVIRISPSSSASGGMYWFNSSNCKMCFANSSNGNWFGCGIGAYWGTGYIPSYNNEQCWGYQFVYIRVKNNKERINRSGTLIATTIKEG